MFRHFAVRDTLLLLLVCFLVFWWRLGSLGLIDPDEPFYAQTAREMVATGDWVTPQIFGHPQFEKPIFYYWLTALSYVVFGETEFAGRVPAALPATLTVLLVYAFGVGFCGRRAAFLSALVMATGLEFAIMSRLMLTDIAIALFIAGSLFSYWRAQEDEAHEGRWIVLHFIFGGLGVLMKGPFVTIVTVLAVVCYSRLMKRQLLYRGRAFWAGVALWALIGWPWYVVMLQKFGWEYWNAFFIHENVMRLLRAEHPANNHWWYYIGILALGSIPWMPPLAITVARACRGLRHDPRQAFLWSWILTSLVFLMIVQSKLPSYIFYVFVPLGMTVGMTLDDLLKDGFRSPLERRLALGCAIFQCVVAAACPFIKVARPFTVPALLLGACLVAGLICAWRGWRGSAIVAHAAATAALITGALTFSRDHVDSYSSARPVAQAMMAGQDGSEPLLAGKFLARGIHYYTRLPVLLISNSPQPFWTPHPIKTVVGKKGLDAFVDEHGPVRMTVRRSEWHIWKTSKRVVAAGEPQWFGDNAVIRLTPRPPKTAADVKPD